MLSYFCGCASKQVKLCDGRVLVEGKFNFTENEEPLICGDKNIQSWKDVPLSQTENNLKNFLRARGYYDSQFKLDAAGATPGRLVVIPGERAFITGVTFLDAPEKFNKVNFVGWKGREIVNQTLDEIEQWTVRRLKNIGYACAKVSLKATPETGKVEVEIVSGPSFEFPEVYHSSRKRWI